MNAVITNKLAFTSLHCSISNHTLKGLRSNKPLHKHDSNNIILTHLYSVIASQIRPDLWRTLKKTWFDWCIDCYLIKTTSTSPIRSCVCGRMQFFKLVGFAGKLFLLSPPPPLPFHFWLLSQLPRRTHPETLATCMQAINLIQKSQIKLKANLYRTFYLNPIQKNPKDRIQVKFLRGNRPWGL